MLSRQDKKGSTTNDLDSLQAISPIDGRYYGRTRALREFFSEYALIRERVTIEVKYLLALEEVEAIPFSLDREEKVALERIYGRFSLDDARAVSQIERVGRRGIGPTNHDVKAVEYFLRERVERIGLERSLPWIHFGLTSEDVDNLAYNRLILRAVHDVILPTLLRVLKRLIALAEGHKGLPMLGHTHGQPASPTTVGKEFAVYLSRVSKGIGHLAQQRLPGKLAGATGNMNAHRFAYPTVDWIGFSGDFIAQLGLEPIFLTTQIQPGDELAQLLFAVVRINNILLDLGIDAWLYISKGYLRLVQGKEAVGSSTMPHKVNPIDFENSEGNLSKANSDLCFLANYLTRSRLQRDLSGSTVRRTIGTGLAHSLLGYKRILDGLGKIAVDEDGIRIDLAQHFEVLAEAAQTALRQAGVADGFERVRKQVEGGTLDEAGFAALLSRDSLLSKKGKLAGLSPAAYIGYAMELAELAVEEGRKMSRQLEQQLPTTGED